MDKRIDENTLEITTTETRTKGELLAEKNKLQSKISYLERKRNSINETIAELKAKEAVVDARLKLLEK